MTDWNPENPFDLGVWSNLGLPPSKLGEKPEGYIPPQLLIPQFVSLDPQATKSPEAKRPRKSLKLNKQVTTQPKTD